MFIFHQHVCVVSDLSVPNITVYRQVEDREHVIVLCESDNTFNTFYSQSFTLSVESKLEYTIRLTSSPCSDLCVFLVTVSPPASFTCEHEVHSNGEVKNLSSQTYTYGLSGKTNASPQEHLDVTCLPRSCNICICLYFHILFKHTHFTQQDAPLRH